MKYNVILADYQKHKRDILELWRENLPKLSVDRYVWFYEKNPEGKPHTWIIRESETGTFVGCCSIYPRFFVINDREIKVGIASDFAINKNHRVLGPALMLQKAVINNYSNLGYDFILGWPNQRSEPVFKRLGYQKLGTSRRIVKPLTIKKKLVKRYAKYLRLVSLFSALMDSVLSSYSQLLIQLYARQSTCIFIEHEDIIQIDKLLGSLPKTASPFKGRYSPDFMKWRYLVNPCEKSNLLVIKDENSGNVIGLCAILIDKSTNALNIIDIVFMDRSNKNSIMAMILKVAINCKVDSISMTYFGGRNTTRLFNNFLFFERQESRSVYVYMEPEAKNGQYLQKELTDNLWLILEGDLDV